MNPTMPAWRVLIVDDHPIVRTGLAALIDAEQDMAVCGQAEDFDAALLAMRELRPDVALVDLSLRGASGLELVKEAERHGIPSIVVSMHEAPTWAQRSTGVAHAGGVKHIVGRLHIVHKGVARQGKVLAGLGGKGLFI